MTKQLTVIEDFQLNIGNMKDQFNDVLPKHIKSEKFTNVVVTAVRNNPKLLEGDRQALFNACMDCAQDGLLPNGVEAALVVFKGKAKYMPMVGGVTKKARNSGEITTIDSLVVYEKDSYEVWIDEKGPHFKHIRARGERGKPILTYAYAITKDGGVYHEEIDETGMTAIQKCCKANDTPWKGPFKDEMRRKSALRRLCKYRLPSSSDMDSVIRRDDDMYDLNDQADKPPATNKPAPSSLEKVVGGEAKPEVVDAEFKEEKSQPDGQVKVHEIEGRISDLTKKNGETNGKAWTKYGCKVEEKWFGTFSSTIFGKMTEAKDQKCCVKISYSETIKEDRTLNDIVSFDTVWEDDVKEVEKAEISDDEIPI